MCQGVRFPRRPVVRDINRLPNPPQNQMTIGKMTFTSPLCGYKHNNIDGFSQNQKLECVEYFHIEGV